MKKLFFLCVVLVAAVTASAQTQIATLSSAGTITTYYGVEALKTAYNAAADGDVITLSDGKFNVPTDTIKKLITIRGAGMEKIMVGDSIIQKPTHLVGNIKVKAPETSNVNQRFMLEGVLNEDYIYVSGNYPCFSKCKLNRVSTYSSKDTVYNANFVHCHVYGSFHLNGDVYCYASYLQDYNDKSNGEMSANLTNCIVETSSPASDLSNSYFTNCIIINTTSNGGGGGYSGNPMFFNCLWVGPVITSTGKDWIYKPFCHAGNQNNHVFSGDSVFVEGSFCELVEEAKQYKGTDGTEVGIHGGTLPFDPTPTVPQITKFDVAPKTDAEGKLSVHIEISQP